MILGPGANTEFNFPVDGVDIFAPTLINDVTVVNATHVTDLRQAICAVENLIVGVTDAYFSYGDTSIIQDGYNISTAIETLDKHIAVIESLLGIVFVDGYSGRVDAIEFGLNSHRVSQGPIDADGYGVHGVIGNVVGTENTQFLQNKKVDTGPDAYNDLTGPKFVARANTADFGNDMIQVFGLAGQLVASVDYRGDAYFAGDISVEGDRIIKGTDIVESSLTVDGSTILGDNTATDSTLIRGTLVVSSNSKSFSIDTTTGNITSDGSNVTLGDNSGILQLNFDQTNITNDLYIQNDFVVDGSTILGNGIGSNTHTIKGHILHSLGNIHTSGDLRALGTSFMVENDTTTINTSDLIIGSSTVTIGNTTIAASGSANGNITSDGYAYEFGLAATSNMNTFVINATTLTEDLIVANDIQISSGSLTSPAVETSNLTVNGPVQFKDGTEGFAGHVWTATDALGNGRWARPVLTSWTTVITDGYTATDAYGTPTALTPTGVYNTEHGEEVFVRADAYGSFTINLPETPMVGDRVRFIDFNGGWSPANSVFVFPNNSGIVRDFSFSDVDDSTDTITLVGHGLLTGQRGVLNSTGTLPSGLDGILYVYAIVIDGSEIQFAASFEDALANIPIDITSQGVGTHTFTAGSIAGSAFLELDVPSGWFELIFNGDSWRVIS